MLDATAPDMPKREIIRARIGASADPQSREGITADVLAILLVGIADLSAGLASAKTVADVAAAAKPLADQLAGVRQALASGALRLPYSVKAGGASQVLLDMADLANVVTDALAGAGHAASDAS